ncbi:MAG TPA: tetratricopeptide repeat protein [Casimicrobiaceae bacterium]|nr:tetratricopeptide repeat protein [Casimicrobiaceae bacterium]
MNLALARELRARGKHAEARELLVALAAQSPNDAELQYEAACVHDFLGEEASAVAYYRAALLGSLSEGHLRGAYLGLGSTYRALGLYTEAEAILRQGVERFPDANEMKVFLAMALHNLGQSKAAVERLLAVLAQTSSDREIQAYRRAILLYAQDIDRTWPE